MNGAPRIAPVPMSSPASCPETIAMIGSKRLGERGADRREHGADRALPTTRTLRRPTRRRW
jgi:hypothetical protein